MKFKKLKFITFFEHVQKKICVNLPKNIGKYLFLTQKCRDPDPDGSALI
jgi:hypothetical protein